MKTERSIRPGVASTPAVARFLYQHTVNQGACVKGSSTLSSPSPPARYRMQQFGRSWLLNASDINSSNVQSPVPLRNTLTLVCILTLDVLFTWRLRTNLPRKASNPHPPLLKTRRPIRPDDPFDGDLGSRNNPTPLFLHPPRLARGKRREDPSPPAFLFFRATKPLLHALKWPFGQIPPHCDK